MRHLQDTIPLFWVATLGGTAHLQKVPNCLTDPPVQQLALRWILYFAPRIPIIGLR